MHANEYLFTTTNLCGCWYNDIIKRKEKWDWPLFNMHEHSSFGGGVGGGTMIDNSVESPTAYTTTSFLISISPPMSATQSELSKGHRALLDLEGRFNAKSHGIVLGIQGSQIEALASCIDIFDQFPYPVIINAAILKLADWFRLRYVWHVHVYASSID